MVIIQAAVACAAAVGAKLLHSSHKHNKGMPPRKEATSAVLCSRRASRPGGTPSTAPSSMPLPPPPIEPPGPVPLAASYIDRMYHRCGGQRPSYECPAQPIVALVVAPRAPYKASLITPSAVLSLHFTAPRSGVGRGAGKTARRRSGARGCKVGPEYLAFLKLANYCFWDVSFQKLD